MTLFKFFLILLYSNFTFSAEDSFRSFRFVEIKKIKELNTLPPNLEVTFDLMCNEEFIQVIRNDWVDLISKRVTIALGALVRENLLISCVCKKKEMTVAAGATFSGREYVVTRIRDNGSSQSCR